MRKTKKKPSWKLWAVILGLLVLLGIGGSSGKDEAPEPVRAAVVTEAPTAAPTAVPTPTPEPTATPYRIHGHDPQTAVYVSRNGVIHFRADCSGMQYYTEMTLEQADAAGYKYCEHCG